jgi:hypothetical protein
VIEHGVSPERGDDAERNSHDDGEHHGDQRELDRGRKTRREIIHDRARRVEAGSHVAAEELPEIAHELDRQGPVEAELVAQRVHLRRRRDLSRDQGHGIGGNHARDHERDGEQAEQRGDEPRQAPEDEGQQPHGAKAPGSTKILVV